MGVWAYASGLAEGRDYVERVPVARLTTGHRGDLLQAVNGASAVATNECGLFSTILAAYRSMQDGHRSEASNSVVVFTDGANSKPGMDIEQMLRELEKLVSVTKPIRVIVLGLGPEINLEELNRIAVATGGRAFQVNNPEEIASIFLRALLRV
jgi:Mg-chelatase subunit ChlD